MSPPLRPGKEGVRRPQAATGGSGPRRWGRGCAVRPGPDPAPRPSLVDPAPGPCGVDPRQGARGRSRTFLLRPRADFQFPVPAPRKIPSGPRGGGGGRGPASLPGLPASRAPAQTATPDPRTPTSTQAGRLTNGRRAPRIALPLGRCRCRRRRHHRCGGPTPEPS